MRLSSVCSEAWRSILSGSSHCVLTILALTLLVVGSSSFEISTSSNILHQASQYKASGGNIMVLNAEGGVDGQACERLSELNDVQASGAIKESEQLIASALPDTKIPGYAVTPGFARVLHAKEQDESQGVLVPNELAKTLGLRAGSTLALKDGRQAYVRGTYAYPNDGRTPGYSYAVLSPTAPSGTFDSCWVSVWPQTDSAENAIWSALTPSAKSDKDSSITLGQLNSSLGERFNGQSLYRDRSTAFLPAAAACMGAALGYAVTRSRRLELASALHCGISKPALLLQICLESGIVIMVSAAISVPISFAEVTQCIDGIDRQQVLLTALCPILTGCASLLLGAEVGAFAIKENHLFMFFKER
ncbi:hypothetical protein KIH75_07965 [Bifidobacterium sp. 64T4]|uniref:hypothetical protein n=1 Tax=Bifidobacterium pongonis TaxID=2834432 RepID=UPI001C592BC4|nr:hypothetical protein [Bifidobacterium pongonis]MBW3095268.1 hypothetical protein [Bifidobacterium pongonis]